MKFPRSARGIKSCLPLFICTNINKNSVSTTSEAKQNNIDLLSAHICGRFSAYPDKNGFAGEESTRAAAVCGRRVVMAGCGGRRRVANNKRRANSRHRQQAANGERQTANSGQRTADSEQQKVDERKPVTGGALRTFCRAAKDAATGLRKLPNLTYLCTMRRKNERYNEPVVRGAVRAAARTAPCAQPLPKAGLHRHRHQHRPDRIRTREHLGLNACRPVRLLRNPAPGIFRTARSRNRFRRMTPRIGGRPRVAAKRRKSRFRVSEAGFFIQAGIRLISFEPLRPARRGTRQAASCRRRVSTPRP